MSEFGEVTGPGTVRFRRLLRGPVELVWDHLTDGDKRGEWLASGPLEPWVGGVLELHFRHSALSQKAEIVPERFKAYDNAVVSGGTVVACDPPRLLRMIWGKEGGDQAEVTFELFPEEGDTVLLIVTHRRLSAQPSLVDIASAWHTHLGILCDRLDGIEPPGYWSAYARMEKEYATLFAPR